MPMSYRLFGSLLAASIFVAAPVTTSSAAAPEATNTPAQDDGPGLDEVLAFWVVLDKGRESRLQVVRSRMPNPDALGAAPFAGDREASKLIEDVLAAADNAKVWDAIEGTVNELLGARGPQRREIRRTFVNQDFRFPAITQALAICCRYDLQSAAVAKDEQRYTRALNRWMLLCTGSAAMESADGINAGTALLSPLLSHVYAHHEAGRFPAQLHAAFAADWARLDRAFSPHGIITEERTQASRQVKTLAIDGAWDIKRRYSNFNTIGSYFDKLSSFVSSHGLAVAIPATNDPFWSISDQPDLQDLKLLEPNLLVHWYSLIAAGRGFALIGAIAQQCEKSGKCPDTLASVSELSDEVWRIDPFGGAELRYKPISGGKSFVLYSVGPDGADDGGKGTEVPGITRRPEHKGDLVFHR